MGSLKGKREAIERIETPSIGSMAMERRRFLQLAAGGLTSALFLGAFEAASQPKGKLAFKVATFRGPSGACLISRVMELRPEFSTEEGIEVSWVWYSDIAAYYTDMMTGHEPYYHAVGANMPAAGRVKGAPLQVVFSTARYTPCILKRTEDKSIRSLADLRGKRFGVSKASFHFQWVKWLAAKQGMNIETDVSLIDSPWLQVRKFMEIGEVDVVMINEPQLSLMLHDNPGKFEILYDVLDGMEKAVGVPKLPDTWAMVHEEWAKNHREEVARFYRAFKKAGQWFDKNYREAAKPLSKPYEDGGTSIPAEIIIQSASSGRLSYPVYPAVEIEDALMKPLKALAEVGAMEGVPTDRNFIYRERLT